MGSEQNSKIPFVAGSSQNALSTDKGIMNSHVNLSPIKLSAAGSGGWNGVAKHHGHMPREELLVGSPDKSK